MKRTIIASIVLASLSSASAFALNLTDGQYQQDQYKLQKGIDGAQESARQADLKAYNAQQTANDSARVAGDAFQDAQKAQQQAVQNGADIIATNKNVDQLKGTVSGNSADIAKNTQGLDALKAQQGTFAQGINDAQRVAGEAFNDAQTAQRLATENGVAIGSNTGRITGAENKLADLEDVVSGSLAVQDEHEERISKNTDGIAKNADAIAKTDKNVDQLSGVVGSNTGRITGAENKLADLEDVVSGSLAVQDEHEERISKNTDAIAKTDKNLGDLKGVVESNTAGQLELNKRVDGVSDKVAGNTDSIKDLNGKVSGNTADIADHGNRLDGLDTKTNQNSFDIAENKKFTEKNKELIDGNTASIADHEDRITQNSHDAETANKNALGAAELANNNSGLIANNTKGIESNRAAITNSQQVNKDYTDRVATQTLSSANSYTNQKFAQLGKRIDKVEDLANAGTASALAASQIPQATESQTFNFGAGLGSYKDQSALALGTSVRINESTITKFAVTTDSQHNFGFGAGLAIGW